MWGSPSTCCRTHQSWIGYYLLSGDGDFDLLIDTVQTQHDTPVEVYGVPALTADSLVRAATAFHPITESLLI